MSALAAPSATWTSGCIYGAQLAYSADHIAMADIDQFGQVRWQMGLHPDTLRWPLAPATPSARPKPRWCAPKRASTAWPRPSMGSCAAI